MIKHFIAEAVYLLSRLFRLALGPERPGHFWKSGGRWGQWRQ